jgi:hypothetical protein
MRRDAIEPLHVGIIEREMGAAAVTAVRLERLPVGRGRFVQRRRVAPPHGRTPIVGRDLHRVGGEDGGAGAEIRDGGA